MPPPAPRCSQQRQAEQHDVDADLETLLSGARGQQVPRARAIALDMSRTCARHAGHLGLHGLEGNPYLTAEEHSPLYTMLLIQPECGLRCSSSKH